MPVARTEVAVAALDGKLYVIGGSTADVDALTSVEEYDPKANEWRERAPLPEGLNHMAATTLNGKIYTVGDLQGARRAIRTVACIRERARTLSNMIRRRTSGGNCRR